MANPIAEAFVAIRPDFTGFQTQLQSGVNAAIKNLKVPAGQQQQLGQQLFGPGFKNEAKSGITGGLKNVKVTPGQQRSFAQQLFGPGFRNEAGRAAQGALVGLGGGQLAAQFAFFGAGGAGLAVLGAAAVHATANFAAFEQTLNVLQETSGATDAQLAQLSRRAVQLGADVRLPAVTAQTAAEAMNELAKAGLSIEDTFSGVDGVLQLATAAQISAADAANIVSAALNSFNLAGTEAVRVADLLAGASIAAQGDIGDMALALQQSAAVADQAGLKVNELVGFITLLAKQGILGSDAGTSIRTSLLRLVPTTKEAQKITAELGIELDRTRTLGAQLPELLDQYKTASAALNPTLRQQVLTQIAGTDAIRALSTAIEAGGDGFRQSAIEVDRQNAALGLAQAQSRGLSGDFAGLQSKAQTLSTAIGEDLAPAVEASIEGLSKMADGLLAVEGAARDVLGPVKDFFKEMARQRDKALPFLDALRDLDPASESVSELQDRLRGSGEFLAEGLKEAIALRKELLDLGLPTNVIDGQIKRIQDQLKALREEQGSDIGLDLARPIDQAIGSAKKLKEAFEAQGLPTKKIDAQIKFLENSLAVAAARAASRSQRSALQVEQFSRALGIDTGELAKLKQVIADEGAAAGRAYAKSLVDGLSTQITAEEGRAIRAARQALEDVRREGEAQIVEAIRSARENLSSLGETLASQVDQLIDLGPIGQRIDELQKKLDDLQENVSRRQLRFDVSTAEQDLREAQEAIAQVGKLTPAQKKSQEEFLEPFREKVQDAKAAVKEFDLEDAIKTQEDLRDAAKKTAEEGLAKLIDSFEDGRISADKFGTLLRTKLKPQLDLIKRENLGLSLEEGFLHNVQVLVDQAKALKSFLNVPGTEPGAQVVRPSSTQAEVNRRIAESAASLAQIQKDARSLSKEEQEKSAITNALLRQLIRVLGGNTRGSLSTGDARPGGRQP